MFRNDGSYLSTDHEFGDDSSGDPPIAGASPETQSDGRGGSMVRWWIYGLLLITAQIGVWKMILPQDPAGPTESARDLLSDRALRSRPMPDETEIDPLEIFRQRMGEIQREESLELRQRRIDPNEKMAPANLASFQPAVAGFEKSVVRLLDDQGNMRAFGTVVRADGLVVSKASEVIDVPELMAESKLGKGVARLIGVNDRYDLALIHVSIDGLEPVTWAEGEPLVGTLLVSPDEAGQPLAVGVVSVASRPLVERGRAYLGVEPVTVAGGVRIERIAARSAAALAGLRVGDVVTRLGGNRVVTHHEFANWIRGRQPGERIPVDLIRNDQEISIEVELDGVDAPAEFNGSPQEEMGAALSGRMSDFELVFQHDLPLWPEQCGSPVVDLDGKVVGLNIARSGRVRGYAIPSGKVQSVVDELIRTVRVML